MACKQISFPRTTIKTIPDHLRWVRAAYITLSARKCRIKTSDDVEGIIMAARAYLEYHPDLRREYEKKFLEHE